MKVNNPAIIVIGFNRPKSMMRLLKSVEDAHYDSHNIPLIISIDNSGNDHVRQLADQYQWPYGEKTVLFYEHRQGLRSHVLQCGDLTRKYGAVIILEDDLFVSREFYRYTCTMLDHYKSDPRIAGISLYSHKWHPGAKRPFIPIPSPYDVYLMQFAQSWGQCWTQDMWDHFRKWYDTLTPSSKELAFNRIPKYVAEWPESSWLKYHIAYTSETNRFFVYPYLSLTTNFSEVGTHITRMDTTFQVELQSQEMNYRIPLVDQEVQYDCYFENKNLNIPGISNLDLCVDLYGLKSNACLKRYHITLSDLPFESIAKYGLLFRPHEANVTFLAEGDEIKLYDTTKSHPCIKIAKHQKIMHLMNYDHINFNFSELREYLLCFFINRIKARLWFLFSKD